MVAHFFSEAAPTLIDAVGIMSCSHVSSTYLGSTCVKPQAPDLDTAVGVHLDSTQISETMVMGSSSFFSASWMMAGACSHASFTLLGLIGMNVCAAMVMAAQRAVGVILSLRFILR
jgi:hypothetical protein